VVVARGVVILQGNGTVCTLYTRATADADFVGSTTEVAVIIAVPGATPVTTPAASTVAFAASDVDHVTACDTFPPLPCTVAANCDGCPTAMRAEPGKTVTVPTEETTCHHTVRSPSGDRTSTEKTPGTVAPMTDTIIESDCPAPIRPDEGVTRHALQVGSI
jgi:hypothetical protein